MEHEERDYLKLCHSILDEERSIRFAGVIDDEDNLLIVRYSSDISS